MGLPGVFDILYPLLLVTDILGEVPFEGLPQIGVTLSYWLEEIIPTARLGRSWVTYRHHVEDGGLGWPHDRLSDRTHGDVTSRADRRGRDSESLCRDELQLDILGF